MPWIRDGTWCPWEFGFKPELMNHENTKKVPRQEYVTRQQQAVWPGILRQSFESICILRPEASDIHVLTKLNIQLISWTLDHQPFVFCCFSSSLIFLSFTFAMSSTSESDIPAAFPKSRCAPSNTPPPSWVTSVSQQLPAPANQQDRSPSLEITGQFGHYRLQGTTPHEAQSFLQAILQTENNQMQCVQFQQRIRCLGCDPTSTNTWWMLNFCDVSVLCPLQWLLVLCPQYRMKTCPDRPIRTWFSAQCGLEAFEGCHATYQTCCQFPVLPSICRRPRFSILVRIAHLSRIPYPIGEDTARFNISFHDIALQPSQF